MKFDFDVFYDFGHYGIFAEEDALYPEVRELLKKALESGEDFDTGWGSFKKEIECIRIQAIGDTITVSVSCSMDEMPNLVYDCENVEELTDEEIEEVVNNWYLSDYTTDAFADDVLPRNSSLLDILEVASKLAEDCNEFLEEGFNSVQAMVNYILKELH